MYSLFRLMPFRRLLYEQVPALVGSFVIAELLYKFHSFTLEALAFLATWAVIDAVIQFARKVFVPHRASAGNAPAANH
jgi:hypothetical protein